MYEKHVESFSESRDTRRNLTRRQLPGDAAAVSGPIRDFLSLSKKKARHTCQAKSDPKLSCTIPGWRDRARASANDRIGQTIDLRRRASAELWESTLRSGCQPGR